MKNKKIQMYTDMIRGAGLKATPQRISVLKVLSEMSSHPSADMLMEALENQGYVMSVGTIYNILETFSEKGLILKLKDNQEVMRFDAKTEFHSWTGFEVRGAARPSDWLCYSPCPLCLRVLRVESGFELFSSISRKCPR